MNFDLTDTQAEVRTGIRETMERFASAHGPTYWRDHDRAAEFPQEFFTEIAAGGWLGIAMPPEYGGAGLGITEATIVLQEVAGSGAALSGASAIHMNIFGANTIVKHGTDAQRERFLPAIIGGKLKLAFGVTEPNAGLDTTNIETRAVRTEGGWLISGQKVWISTAQVADRILLAARTTPRDEGERRTDGITLFFADIRKPEVRIAEIEKCGRAAVDSNEVWLADLFVADDDVIGGVGRGFYHLLDSLNPERILVASEAVGIGRAALAIATRYANERRVFGRAIGQNQGIQFPLARCYAELELADLMVRKAAWLYDSGRSCGPEANIAKLMGAEAGFHAADQAMQTLGGFGYAKEYEVERLWREVKLCRLAPVSPELILAYLGEKVLGLPRSY
jgi:acyl-CoA dehydrogenase